MPTGHFFRTEEHRKNIGLALKGRAAPWAEKEKMQRLCPCGVSFSKTPARAADLKRGKYCSRPCYYKFRRPPWNAGLTGYTRPPMTTEQKRKISATRVHEGSARGGNNPNWRGGLTKLQAGIRNCAFYREWRHLVYERDKYICQNCGAIGNGRNLNAEHIRPLSVLLFENKIRTLSEAMECGILWDVKNGKTLCIDCHKQTDSYGWNVYNNYLKSLLKGGDNISEGVMPR